MKLARPSNLAPIPSTAKAQRAQRDLIQKNRDFSSLRSSRLRGRNEFGYTLIELLVIIGIIAILLGILLPAYSNMRKKSYIIFTKNEFQTIEGALGDYHNDFHSYPMNGLAQIDPGTSPSLTYSGFTNYIALTQSPSGPGPDIYRPATPRTDPTLAMALLGLGPFSSVPFGAGGSNYAYGDTDGADGPGFRTQYAPLTNYSVTYVSSSGTTLTVSSTVPTVPSTGNPTAAPLFTAVSIGGPGSPDIHVPIVGASGTSITLATPLQGNLTAYTGLPVGLLVPNGKVWGPYLPVDKFKVGYFTTPNQPASPKSYEPLPLPQILDAWGNPILYFPAYNSYIDQAAQYQTPFTTSPVSTSPTGLATITAPVVIGPIFGFPNTLGAQYNTPIPKGVLYSTQTTQVTGPSIFWSGPLGAFGGPVAVPASGALVPFTTGQVQAILVKLGDQNANNYIDSPANPTPPPPNVTETFNLSQPYFLLSAGPDGHFEDLTNDPSTDWPRTMTKSDDIYSFDQ
jgi:type II secretory pathway pseudopilin PulG